MKLNNHKILLTGGTSGIGLELLKQFYPDNTVVVSSRNQGKLDQLKEDYPEVQTIQCDLGDSESVDKLIDECLQNHSEINMLINNAGLQFNYTWPDDAEGMDKIENEIRVNFTSPMKLIYGLLPLLKEKDEAAIINVSSGLAFAPKKSAPIYCATKAALHNATKGLRYQLEGTNVKVFEIIPPLVDTPMTEGRGKGKLTTKALVDEFIKNFKKDNYESNIGKTKLLRFIQRISPRTADNILKNG